MNERTTRRDSKVGSRRALGLSGVLAATLVVGLVWSLSNRPERRSADVPDASSTSVVGPVPAPSQLDPLSATVPLFPGGERSSAPRAEVAVIVVDSLGKAIEGAQLTLAIEGRPLHVAATDPAGSATLGRPDGTAELMVSFGVWLAASRSVGPSEGHLEIVFDVGGMLTGSVELDGQPASNLAGVALCGVEGWRQRLIPPAVARAHGFEVPPEFICPPLPVRADGTFLLAGLDPDWSGFVRAPWSMEFVDGASKQWIEGPTLGLRLRLRSIPALTGRLLAPGCETAPRSPRGVAELRCASGSTLMGLEFSDDGHFRVPLACPPVLSAEIEVWADDAARETLKIENVHPSGHYLGDICLRPGRSVDLLVTDEAGAPIVGAIADSGWPDAETSPATGPDGTVAVAALPAGQASEVTVRALGYAAVTFSINPATIETVSPLPVVLERLSEVLVRLGISGGPATPAQRLEVVLRSEEPFHEGMGRQNSPVQLDLGADRPQSLSTFVDPERGGAKSVRLVYPVQAGAPVRIVGVVPGTELALAVLDAADRSVRRVVVAATEQPRTQEIDLSPVALDGCVALHVVGEDGSDVSGARVLVVGSRSRAWATDEHGEVRLSGLVRGVVDLVVVDDGYAAELLIGVEMLPGNREALRVALGRGASFAIHARDPKGLSIEIEQVLVRLADLAVGHVVRSEDGSSFVVENAPEADLEVHVRVAGKWHLARRGDSDTSVLIEVPECGRIAIEPDVERTLAAPILIELERRDDPDIRVTRRIPSGDTFRREVLPPLPAGGYVLRLVLGVDGNGTGRELVRIEDIDLARDELRSVGIPTAALEPFFTR